MTSYLLIKIVPFWGLTLIGTCALYITPWVYRNNREIIDQQIQNASDIVNKQANQVKDLAGQHTARASENLKAYAGDYSAKAQEYMGSVRQRVPSANAVTGTGKSSTATRSSTSGSYKSSDFPAAPKSGLQGSKAKSQDDPLAAT